MALKLAHSASHPVLLHGDLVNKNLLWDAKRYVAIDPIPAIGDPCSDIGFSSAGHPPVSGILARADAIACRMGHDALRAQCWAVIWTVLQATQGWRSDQAELEELTSGATFDELLEGGG